MTEKLDLDALESTCNYHPDGAVMAGTALKLIARIRELEAAQQARGEPVAKVASADEYGPIIEWSTHWVDLIGKSLYAAPVSANAGVASAPEDVMRAGKAAVAHWNEFGPECDFSRAMDALEAAIASSTSAEDKRDAERYRWLRDALHGAKAGGGIEVNDALQVYEKPTPGEEVRVYWFQDTPAGFYEVKATTLDEAVDAAIAASKTEGA